MQVEKSSSPNSQALFFPTPPALKITATDVLSNSFANGSFTGGFWKQNVCLLVVLYRFERLVVI